MWNAAATWVRRRTRLVLAGAILASLAVLSPATAEGIKQPHPPSRVTVVGVSPSSASVSWQAPRRSRRLGQVAGYGLYVNGTRVATTKGLRYTFGGLNCGTTYTLAVDSYFASGRRSEVVTLTTSTALCRPARAPRDTSPPSPPSGVARTAATANAISLAWNPSADLVGVAGYGAYRSGAKIGTTAETRYTFVNLSCGRTYRLGVDSFDAAGNRSTVVMTNASTAACGPPPPPPPPPPLPPAGDVLPTFDLTITPNWSPGQDDFARNYQALWIYPKSPTTPWRSPDSRREIARYMLLDPRSTDSEGRVGQDEWWIIIERNWPSSYPASNHGDWGRQVNFHSVAGDDGQIAWGCPGNWCTGVSALALDWRVGEASPSMCVLCAIASQGGASYPLPVPQRDVWQTYVMHWIAGRTDGSTVRPGLVQIWVNGNDTPVVNRTNINTIQRARDPGGVWRLQRWMVLWEGDYTRALPVSAKHRLVLTRMGRTLAEALADRPVVAGTTAVGQYYRGSGTNEGPPTAVQVTSRSASAARIPPSLGGSNPPPPPP